VEYFGFVLERDVEPLANPFPAELAEAARTALVEALLAGETPHPDQGRLRRALERLGVYWRRSSGRLAAAATDQVAAELAAPVARRGAEPGARGQAGKAALALNALPGCHSNATTLSVLFRGGTLLDEGAQRRPQGCDVAACRGSLLLGSVLSGTLTRDHGYARTYVSEREEFQSPTPAGVRTPRSGGAGNVRRGGRGVRPVRSDAVREPA